MTGTDLDETYLLIAAAGSGLAAALTGLAALFLLAAWLLRRRPFRNVLLFAAVAAFIGAAVAAVPVAATLGYGLRYALQPVASVIDPKVCEYRTGETTAISQSGAMPDSIVAALLKPTLSHAAALLGDIRASRPASWVWDRIRPRVAWMRPSRFTTTSYEMPLGEVKPALASLTISFAREAPEGREQTPRNRFALACYASDGSRFEFRPFGKRIEDINLVEHMTFQLPDQCIAGKQSKVDVVWEDREDMLASVVHAATVGGEVRSLSVPAKLSGYLDDDIFQAGQELEFRLNSPSGIADMTVRRLGGDIREVGTLRNLEAPAKRIGLLAGRDGVNWPVSMKLQTSGWAGGYYQYELRSGTDAYYGYFLLGGRKTEAAKIAVIASTNTWQAYNSWGGQSLYANGVGNCIGLRVSNLVSFNRPTTIGPSLDQVPYGRSHLVQPETLIAGWLERSGYAFDVYSDLNVHTGQADLSQYRAVVLTSHPEYWTNEMRLALEAYLKRGGSVVYLGGNGIYERVSLRDGRMEGYNHRQVHEQDGLLGGFFYLNEWPQSQILGVQYDSRGFGESEPYVVEDARSWVFAGTGVRPGDRFGRGTMGIEQIGAAGHETDKMNAASPPGTMLLARGDGRSGAHMTLYEHPAGGFVFAAGSIAFGLTLGQDDVQGRVVRNVLDAALKR